MRTPLISRLRLMVAALVLALAGGLACTPGVVLPPPVQLTALSFQASSTPGTVVLQGAIAKRHENVRFFAYNLKQKKGVIAQTNADGSFTSEPFPGAENDTVQLYYENAGGDFSDSICTTIVFGAPLGQTGCF